MSDLETAKMPQKAVKRYEDAIKKAQDKVDSLAKKMQELADEVTVSPEWNELSQRIDEINPKLKELQKRKEQAIKWTGSEANAKELIPGVFNQIHELATELAHLEERRNKLEVSGKAFRTGADTIEYRDLEKQMNRAQGQLKAALTNYEKGKADFQAATENEYANTATELTKEQDHLNELSRQYDLLSHKMQVSAGLSNMAKGFKKLTGAAKKAFSVIQKGISVTWKGLKNLGSSLIKLTKLSAKTVATLSGIGPLFNVIRGNSKSSGQAISGFGRRILELAKSAFIFNLLSAGFRELTSGIGDAFQVYLGYDTSLKNSINGLRAQLSALQGSLSSAFAPIISVVIPYLSTLISWVTTAANAVAAFIATLTGKSSYKKAVANVSAVGAAADSTAGSLGDAAAAAEELEKALGHYDELNVIDQPKDSSGGSGGGGGGAGGGAGDITYEDVEIQSAISDFAEKVKEAWANSDFTEIGGIIGQKLEDALDSIPWDGIQTTAQKIGKSVATLINGFVETSGLGKMVGITLGEAINTGILGVEQFTGNLRFESIGQFIADGVIGTLDTIEWDGLTDIANDIGKGLAGALNRVITPKTFSSVGSSLAKVLNTVISGAYSFLNTADFTLYADGIAKGINKFVEDADWNKIGKTIGKGLQKALDFVATLISSLKWGDIKNALQKLWEGIAAEVDMGKVGSILLGAFAAWMALNAAGIISKTISQAVIGNIVSSLLGVSAGTRMEIAATSFAANLASKLASAFGSAATLGIIASGVALIIKGVNDMLKDPDTYINNAVRDYIEENPGALGEGAETPEVEVTITGDNEPFKESIDDSVAYANETLPNETSVEINVSSLNIPKKLLKISGLSVVANKILPGTGTVMSGLTAMVSSVFKANNINSLEDIEASVKEVFSSGSLFLQGVMAKIFGVEKQSGAVLQLKDVLAYARSAGWMSNANKKMQIQAIAGSVGWDKNPDKTVTVSAFTKAVSWAKNADKSKDVTAYTKLINWAKGADKTKTVTAYTKGLYWAGGASKILQGITGYIKSVEKQSGVSLILRGITGMISAFIGKATGGIFQNNTWHSLPQKSSGGIFSMNSWKNIPKYASGGSPHGTMFVAGEAGPEVVGHVGGRTEVLNKSQIASAIAGAISGVMNTALNQLGAAVLSHMTECTNMVISNMGYIVDSIYGAAGMTDVPQIQFAGTVSGYMSDTNRTSTVYNAGYSGGTPIDYDKLAGAVANRISGNMQIENIMYMDKEVVYRKVVEVDRTVINQTGKSGFER